MTKSVGVHEAKTHLSRLLDQVRAGEDIVIERRGHPIARLTRIQPVAVPVFGSDRGKVVVADNFDAPLPDDLADSLGG